MKLVKDSLKFADPRDPKNADAKIEVEYEYPQAESLADFTNWCGGEDKHLEFANAAAAAKAVNNAKLKEITPLDEGATEQNIKSAVARLVASIKNYIPTVGRTASATKFTNALKDAMANGKVTDVASIKDLAAQFGITM